MPAMLVVDFLRSFAVHLHLVVLCTGSSDRSVSAVFAQKCSTCQPHEMQDAHEMQDVKHLMHIKCRMSDTIATQGLC